MATERQRRWMRLIELLNSTEFDLVSAWFDDRDGNELPLMANRIDSPDNVPETAWRLKIRGRTWVRDDDWIVEDIAGIAKKLTVHSNYYVYIDDDSLFIEQT
jgi:hypothetical protein